VRDRVLVRPGFRYTTFTIPNQITFVRTLVSCVISFLVLADKVPHDDRTEWMVAAFAIYWVGDSADGLSARLLKQETRGGALLDTLCDRVCICLAVAGATVVIEPPVVPVLLYLFNFMVLDFWLSLRFVDYEIDTNNRFYEVDRTVYRFNWSPLAKTVNSAAVCLLALFAPWWASTPFLLALIAIKAWSWSKLRAGQVLTPA
jgi:CDP-diacylglycerol--glycerol-3-phosphate 3-phosphatidyltransferase